MSRFLDWLNRVLTRAFGPGSKVGEVSSEHSPVRPVGERFSWPAILIILALVGGAARNGPLIGLVLLAAVVYVFNYGWAFFSLSGLKVERELTETRLFYGEPVGLNYLLINNKPLPLPWLEVYDVMPARLKLNEVQVEVPTGAEWGSLTLGYSLGWYERVERRLTGPALPRGAYDFGPITMTSGDVFSFFKRERRLDQRQELLVYPRIVPVEAMQLPADLFFGDFKAHRHLITDPLRPLATRAYAWGDSARHIHWKASARSGSLLTKIYEPVANLQLHIVLNQETYARVWEGLDKDALELAITVAGSLAQHALDEGFQVGLEVNATTRQMQKTMRQVGGFYESEHVRLPASRHPEQLTHVLESLARLAGCGGIRQPDLLGRVRHSLPRGATVLLVTAVLDEASLDELIALRQAGHPVVIVRVGGAGLAAVEVGDIPLYDIVGEDYRALASIALA